MHSFLAELPVNSCGYHWSHRSASVVPQTFAEEFRHSFAVIPAKAGVNPY